MERKKILKFKSKILEINPLSPSVKNCVITTPSEFDFFPGQFISLVLKKRNQKIRRSYSIASKPSKGSLNLCIKILPNGLLSQMINTMKVGDELEVLGPLGDFIIKDTSKDIVLISTGTGISPFRSMIYDLLENNFKNKIMLLTGYGYEKDILYEKEFKELEKKYKNFSYHRILSKSKKDPGYVQSLVKKNLIKNADYYLCGLKEMVNSVKELLIEKGIPKENIYFEKYN